MRIHEYFENKIVEMHTMQEENQQKRRLKSKRFEDIDKIQSKWKGTPKEDDLRYKEEAFHIF